MAALPYMAALPAKKGVLPPLTAALSYNDGSTGYNDGSTGHNDGSTGRGFNGSAARKKTQG
eukprot:2226338-Rhodomonas_salina.2